MCQGIPTPTGKTQHSDLAHSYATTIYKSTNTLSYPTSPLKTSVYAAHGHGHYSGENQN